MWHSNSCLTSPVSAFQTIALLSTEPDNSSLGAGAPPLPPSLGTLAHFSEKIGPECATSERTSEPSAADQRRATPSYEPVASRVPSGDQSSVVTSRVLPLPPLLSPPEVDAGAAAPSAVCRRIDDAESVAETSLL